MLFSLCFSEVKSERNPDNRRQSPERFGASVKTARREVRRVLDAQHSDAPHRYAGLQMARLEKALQIVSAALDDGDLRAVTALTRLLGEMDRYQGFAGPFDPAGNEPLALEAPARNPIAALIQGLRAEMDGALLTSYL